jgi:hypothetical protein
VLLDIGRLMDRALVLCRLYGVPTFRHVEEVVKAGPSGPALASNCSC